MQKLKEIVSEKEKERAGILAPKLQREAASKPLEKHLEEFVADLKVKGRVVRYRQNINSQVTKLCTELNWKHPGDVDANDFLAWRSRQSTKPKTLNEYLNSINSFLNWMLKNERIATQPLKNVEKVDTRGRQQKRRAYTDEEIKKLLNVAGEFKLLYQTATFTGLRLGELMGLVWGNVNLNDKQPHIHVPAHLTKNKLQAIVPLHPELVKAFEQESASRTMTDKIFPQRAKPHQTFLRHRKKAGVQSVDEMGRILDFHSFRYTFATKLAKQGISQRLTQELMRHSDPRLTANLYTDVSHLPTFEAVQNLEWLEEDLPQKTTEKDLGTHRGTQNCVPTRHFASHAVTINFDLDSSLNLDILRSKGGRACHVEKEKMALPTGFEPVTY